MSRKPSQAQLTAVLSQLTETDFKSIADLTGPREANLFAIRELFRQGLIKGVLIDDPLGAEDDDGPLLCNAERLRLPLCETPLQAQPTGGSVARGALNVAVRCDGRDGAGAWTVYVPVRVTQHLQIVVLAKPLSSGAVITADALRLQELDTANLSYGYFTQPEQAIGKVLRKSLAGGNILTPDALEAPYAIKRGQQVTLLSRAGTIEVRADGKALSNAADGERVRVESGASRRIVEGVARSGSVVEVNL